MAAAHVRKSKPASWYFDFSLLFQYWGEDGATRKRAFHHTAPVASIYADGIGADAKFFAKDSVVVFKSHRPGRSFRDLLKRGDLSLILTVREPRDAVASLMLRWNLDFERALAQVEASARALARLAGHHPRLLLRYEENFLGRDETLAAVARFLVASMQLA
jgi:hypothetical protein